MKDLAAHCSDLSRFVSGYHPEVQWGGPSEWLRIASGVVSVNFDIGRFDDNIGWCSSADEFLFSEETLLQSYVTSLTRFGFIWGAFESLIDAVKDKPKDVRGKVNRITSYLHTHLQDQEPIPPYRDLIARLRLLLTESDIREEPVLRRFDNHNAISEHGIAAHVIYKLRNRFAHGAVSFPLPDCNNQPRSAYPILIDISSRLILLTMQMVWLAHYQKGDVTSPAHWETFEDVEFPIEEILRKIHIAEPIYVETEDE